MPNAPSPRNDPGNQNGPSAMDDPGNRNGPGAMDDPGDQREPARRGPVPPVARATVRMRMDDFGPARGTASVAGAIDPWLRFHQPYAPPPVPSEPLPPPIPSPDAHVDPAVEDVIEAETPPGKPVPPRGNSKPSRGSSQPPRGNSEPSRGSSQPSRGNSEPLREIIDDEPSARPPAPNQDVPPVRRPSRLRRALLPLVAAVVAAFVGGTGYLMVADRDDPEATGRWTGTPAASASPADPAPYAVSEGGADPFGTRAPTYTGEPTRLKVDAIGLDTTLESLTIGGNGELTPPVDFARAGWYADGTPPGDVGPAVIAGHVDSRRGPAVFYDLRKLAKGDTIEVVRGGQTVRFTVVSAGWYPKNQFPTDAVYGPTPDRQLRLITCGGVFDRSLRSYKDNLVVYAVAG